MVRGSATDCSLSLTTARGRILSVTYDKTASDLGVRWWFSLGTLVNMAEKKYGRKSDDNRNSISTKAGVSLKYPSKSMSKMKMVWLFSIDHSIETLPRYVRIQILVLLQYSV